MTSTFDTAYLTKIKETICCPAGKCISPYDCYAIDSSRSYPVQIHEAAKAIIAVVAPMIQAAERERAAKMVEDFGCHDCEMDTDLATAIRDIPEETGDE